LGQLSTEGLSALSTSSFYAAAASGGKKAVGGIGDVIAKFAAIDKVFPWVVFLVAQGFLLMFLSTIFGAAKAPPAPPPQEASSLLVPDFISNLFFTPPPPKAPSTSWWWPF
jgi:hypothetical protein